MKLTPRQRAVLMAMKEGAEVRKLDGHAWTCERGFYSSISIHMSTFNSLSDRRLIERAGVTATGALVYRISPAGRAALEGTNGT